MTEATSTPIDELTLTVTEEIRIDASLDDSFEALLQQMGPHNEGPDGTAMPMTLEARPGGRWFRDLGGENGHHWGHVQAIKRPMLLEITGPLFMSYPVASNLQYRLTAAEGGTLVTLRHSIFGVIPADHRRALSSGWMHLLARVKGRAEAG
jgi:uncharacterized protein YndB with AHSA1/START domain